MAVGIGGRSQIQRRTSANKKGPEEYRSPDRSSEKADGSAVRISRQLGRPSRTYLKLKPEVEANLDDLLGVLDRETLDGRAKWAR
jgi:hypothetical protein